MTLFSRRPHRLEDPILIEAAVRTLHKEGFERHDIEEALIRTAPVDLDILAQCLARVLRGAIETMDDLKKDDRSARGPASSPSVQGDTGSPVQRAA